MRDVPCDDIAERARRIRTVTSGAHTPAVFSPQPLFAVRQAEAIDIPLLAHHRVAMFRDMGQLASRQEGPLERATASYLRDALACGEYLAWVAEDKGTPPSIIGGAGVQLRRILPRPGTDADDLELGPEAIVLNVYVEPGWRRRGVAEALMRAVLDALAVRGIRRIVLHASDDGRRLYERLGFVPTNEMRLSPR
jgi:GNAT superfamily N-acetyltransferase